MIQPIRTKDGRILARKREREITELTVKSTTFSPKTVLELLSHVSTKEMQVLKKKDENSNKSVVIFFWMPQGQIYQDVSSCSVLNRL